MRGQVKHGRALRGAVSLARSRRWPPGRWTSKLWMAARNAVRSISYNPQGSLCAPPRSIRGGGAAIPRLRRQRRARRSRRLAELRGGVQRLRLALLRFVVVMSRRKRSPGACPQLPASISELKKQHINYTWTSGKSKGRGAHIRVALSLFASVLEKHHSRDDCSINSHHSRCRRAQTSHRVHDADPGPRLQPWADTQDTGHPRTSIAT